MQQVLKIICILWSLGMIVSCANIVMPSGGAKDTTPPNVIKTNPEANSTNFKGDELVLTFNEFVDIDAPQKNIFISPYLNQSLEYYISGKKLYIHFPEGLKQNTTYSIQLNKAIKDFTEGNYMNAYSLNFSTGAVIDSGKLSIDVRNLKTKANSDMTVVCLVKHKADFFGKNYSYVAKAEGGVAKFSNLNSDLYYIYAFVDSNQNMKWEKTEQVGFLKELIKSNTLDKKIKLFNNQEDKTSFLISAKSKNEFDIQTTQPVFGLRLKDTHNVLIQLAENSYRLITKSHLENNSIELLYNRNKIEKIDLPKSTSPYKLERINLDNAKFESEKRNDSLKIDFTAFISKIDTNRITLKAENDTVKAKVGFNQNKLILTRLDFGKKYNLIIDSQALWSLGTYNKPINYFFSTYPKEKYWQEVAINVDADILNQKAKLYLIDNTTQQELKLESKIILKNVYGDFLTFHIIIDQNNNGYWDSGKVEKEIQPEPYYIETISLDPKTKEYFLKTSKP